MLKGSILLGIIVASFAVSSQVFAAHYPSTCHLKANHPGDVVIVYNNGKGLISDRRTNTSTDAFRRTANIPAGRYKISLEAFDGYTGRSKTRGQTNERYYISFYNANTSLVATSGATGDVADGVEQAYWRGVVNNSITFDKSVSSIVVRHLIPYYNANPNSVTPVCMLLENLDYAPPKPKINGVCGSSNGKTFDTKPTTGLCSKGNNSSVSGTGPWHWSCRGSNGGSTASCSATITAPVCGSSHGQTFDTKPTTGLCSVGNASSVSGSGPWNWTCINGTRRISCNAQITAAPICGSSDGQTFSAKPTSGLCSVGNASSVSGSGPWNWTCTSGARFVACDADYAKTAIQIVKSSKAGGDTQTIEGGADATFTITVTNTGEENLQNIIIVDEAASDCSKTASQTQSLYAGNLLDPDESFTYSCIDTSVDSAYTNVAKVVANATTSDLTVEDQDNSRVEIKDKVAPNCGSSNGQTFSAKPTSGLCSVGNASSVSGSGPWNWTCTNDGEEVNCSANITIQPQPEPQPEKPEKDGAIGNFVWNDRNKNCVQDPGEEGISDVKLKLYNGNKVETDRTNSRGRYKFKELKKGTYKVVVAQETLPAGCYQVCDPDGTKMDGKTKVKIKGDEYNRKADFGYYCPSNAPVVASQTSPTTGPGAAAGTISFIAAALSAGYVRRRYAHDAK
jgi:hypothetical protein